MIRKIVFAIFFGGPLFILVGIIGGFIGMVIGGNYLQDFEMFGVRGYEAVGNLGAISGSVIGALSGAIIGFRLGGIKSRKKP